MKNKEIKVSDYYSEKREEFIEKLKLAVDQCLTIIGESIDNEISDDKLYNVLKGKKMASEDAEHYIGQIKRFEDEINGVDSSEEKKKEPVNMAKKYAKKPA